MCSQSVAEAFVTFQKFPASVLKIALYSAYLSRLLGFTNVVAGGIIPVVAIFLSRRLARNQRKAQAELVNATGSTNSLVAEALNGLRQIRLSSMERLWQGRLLSMRENQLGLAWNASLLYELNKFVVNLGPVLFASATMSIYALRTGHFSASVAFTSINLFDNLLAVIKELPGQVSSFHRSRLSYNRLLTYFQLPEQVPNATVADTILLKDASLSWSNRDEEAVLKNIDLGFPRHKFSLVTGKVGSGKSLLLSAILEEAVVQFGHLSKPAVGGLNNPIKAKTIIPGSTAYVSQPPWIEDATIRANIIFGYPVDEERYQKVVQACGLAHDLAALKDGDLTTAGTGGASLSGGQKWRVAFARALYSPAECIVAEDILAAVDAPIARHICNHALQGELMRERTMILASHQPEYCSALAAYVVSLKNGRASVTSKTDLSRSTVALDQATWTPKKETGSIYATDENPPVPNRATSPKHTNAQNYWETLRLYVETSQNLQGYIYAVLVVLCSRAIIMSNSWWLAKWTSNDGSNNSERSTIVDIGIYLLLSVAGTACIGLKSLFFTKIGHESSMTLFTKLIRRVFKAKLSWIDSTPPGQVTQTLNNDMYAIDHRMAPQVIGILGSAAHIVFICINRYVKRHLTSMIIL